MGISVVEVVKVSSEGYTVGVGLRRERETELWLEHVVRT